MKQIKEIIFEKLTLNKSLKKHKKENVRLFTNLYLENKYIKFPLNIKVKSITNNREYEIKLVGYTIGKKKYGFYDENINEIFILNWNEIFEIFERHNDSLKLKFTDNTYNYIKDYEIIN